MVERGAALVVKEGGRTEALAKAEADAVERRAELAERRAGLGGDVPDSCAVEVHHDAVAVSVVGDTNDLVLGEYGAIERVLERDDFRRSAV